MTLLDLCTAAAAVAAGVAAVAPRGAPELDSTPATTTASRQFPAWRRRARTHAFAVSTAMGAAACVGWAWTIARTHWLRAGPPAGTGGAAGDDDAARVDFDAYRMTWLPVACVAAPGVCWHVYQSLERGTVVEAAG